MVRIRLRRVGAKKQPHYRVVVADQHSPRDGRHIEVIGHYDPRTVPVTVVIKEDRALYWLGQGAQPSGPVRRMLDKQGTLTRLDRLKAGEALEALVAEYEAGGVTEESTELVEVEAEVEAPVAEAEVEAEVEAPVAEAEVEAEVEAPVAEVEAEAEAEAPVAEVEAEAETDTSEAEAETTEPDAETEPDAAPEDEG